MSDEPLDELVQYARRLTADGLVVGTAGNISIRLGDEIVITPTSIPYERIERDDLCVLGVDGRRRPSSETPLHTRI